MAPADARTPSERRAAEGRLRDEAKAAGMALIPGGTFQMGDGKQSDSPVHAVTVAAFAMDLTEVTVAAYAACVEKGACTAASTTQVWDGKDQGAGACNGSRADRQNHPVNCVDAGQAAAYCRAAGKRLPTEEEWEYAARGGAEDRTYSWGNDAPGSQLCWSGDTQRRGTCPVASYPPGAFNLADMAGNVWEWTASDYDATARVLRGGSWYLDDASDVRGADRYGIAPSNRVDFVGVRCARLLVPCFPCANVERSEASRRARSSGPSPSFARRRKRAFARATLRRTTRSSCGRRRKPSHRTPTSTGCPCQGWRRRRGRSQASSSACAQAMTSARSCPKNRMSSR